MNALLPGPLLVGPVADLAVASSGGGWVTSWARWVIAGALLASLLLAVLVLAVPRSVKHQRIQQIEHFGPGRVQAPSSPSPEATVGGMIARTALAATASVVRSGRWERRTMTRLERAGSRLRAREWVLIRVGASAACGALLFTVGHVGGAVAGVVVGWVLTALYQRVRIARRTAAFTEQLPDALQLVIGWLRSGFSLPQALDCLVREAAEPVAAEFGRALSEHRLGADLSDALERVAQRTRSDDLGWAVMAVRIQREVGGSLAEVLQTTVDTMRERGWLRRNVHALSAEGASAWVLIGLPLALALFMSLYRRDYLLPLVTDPLGITMLIGGSALFVVGIFWIIRLVKVDA